MQVYNSFTQQKELFQPIESGKVKIYVCGPTVYDFCHIGNARTYAGFDVIIRYLRWRGFDVTYVRNITDIDDKIIKRANENNESFQAVVDRYTTAMHDDFGALGLLKPNHEPRATEYVGHIIALIKRLLENGSAYIAQNGDVYFDVRGFKDYGKLSHHSIDQLKSGARVEVVDVKRDPLDFVLWKLAKPNEPTWESPWGLGRPGWHIECSAMSMSLLGETFDMHGGGKDLIFPHHENEVAQTEAATHKKFVNVWMHTGYLQIEKEKMSKSLGNFFTIRELLAKHTSEVLRYFLITSHYRSPLHYSEELMGQSHQALKRFYLTLRNHEKAALPHNTSYEKAFIEAMDDDFNTPVAFSVLFDLSHEIQRLRDKDPVSAAAHAALLKHLGGVFGILQEDPDQFLRQGVEAVDQIEALIEARRTARANKNWAESDRIRDELSKMNVVLEDGPKRTTWRVLG